MKSFLSALLLSLFSVFTHAQLVNFQHDGMTRQYQIHLPTGYSSSGSYPLVFNVHGYTSSSTDQRNYTQMDAVADTAGFIVVYPEGTNQGNGNGWNAGFGLNPTIDDVGFINDLLDYLISQYAVDTTRVYTCGLSNGGFMSHRLACELSDRFTAMASVAGPQVNTVASSCGSAGVVPAMLIHGTADATVDYNGENYCYSAPGTLDWWISHNGSSSTIDSSRYADINSGDQSTVDRFSSKNAAGKDEAVLLRVNNGGHTWPGVYALPNMVTNQDVHGSVVIWEFFRQFQTSGGGGTGVVSNRGGSFSVYPNPSDGMNITVNMESTGSVRLFEITGKLIYQVQFPAGKNALQLPGTIYDGLYIIQVKSGNTVYTEQLVIQH